MSRESCIKVLQDVFERDMACVGITLTHEALEAVIKYLKDVPSADVPHWIPCSEKVPEIEVGKGYITVKAYLVTMLRVTKDKKYSGTRVDLARFMPDLKDGEWGGTWRNDWLVSNEKYDTEVIAWMPIPKPYNPYTVSGAKDGEDNE